MICCYTRGWKWRHMVSNWRIYVQPKIGGFYRGQITLTVTLTCNNEIFIVTWSLQGLLGTTRGRTYTKYSKSPLSQTALSCKSAKLTEPVDLILWKFMATWILILWSASHFLIGYRHIFVSDLLKIFSKKKGLIRSVREYLQMVGLMSK